MTGSGSDGRAGRVRVTVRVAASGRSPAWDAGRQGTALLAGPAPARPRAAPRQRSLTRSPGPRQPAESSASDRSDTAAAFRGEAFHRLKATLRGTRPTSLPRMRSNLKPALNSPYRNPDGTRSRSVGPRPQRACMHRRYQNLKHAPVGTGNCTPSLRVRSPLTGRPRLSSLALARRWGHVPVDASGGLGGTVTTRSNLSLMPTRMAPSFHPPRSDVGPRFGPPHLRSNREDDRPQHYLIIWTVTSTAGPGPPPGRWHWQSRAALLPCAEYHRRPYRAPR